MSTDSISDQESWPPRDPDTVHGGDPNKDFSLPPSPWTFENGSVNPNLQPSNSARRRTKANTGASALPPYHPDYQAAAAEEESEDDEYYEDNSRVRVRRGSEGYEVRPGNREDMLTRYLSEIGETRYHYYVPEPESDNESEAEDTPLTNGIQQDSTSYTV